MANYQPIGVVATVTINFRYTWWDEGSGRSFTRTDNIYIDAGSSQSIDDLLAFGNVMDITPLSVSPAASGNQFYFIDGLS